MLQPLIQRRQMIPRTIGTYSGEICLRAVFLAFATTSVSFICSEANAEHCIQNYSEKSNQDGRTEVRLFHINFTDHWCKCLSDISTYFF